MGRLGPQSSFMSSELNETIKVMKSVSSLEDYLIAPHENGTNLVLELIHDLCEAFQKNHGTGTSSLITYVLLLLELYDEKFSHHSEHSHSQQSLISNSLNLFERIFVKSCNALLIASDPWDQPLDRHIQQQQSMLQSQTDPRIDEFSWFFDDPITGLAAPSPIALDSSSVGQLDPLSVEQSDQQIFCGLQHSLWWDYPAKASPSDATQTPLNSSCVVRQPFSSVIFLIATKCSGRMQLKKLGLLPMSFSSDENCSRNL
jgi:hypothetical protein